MQNVLSLLHLNEREFLLACTRCLNRLPALAACCDSPDSPGLAAMRLLRRGYRARGLFAEATAPVLLRRHYCADTTAKE